MIGVRAALVSLSLTVAVGCASAPLSAPDTSVATPPLTALAERHDIDDTPLAETLAQSDAPVVVAFFATWCRPCRAELALLERLAEETDGRVRFVAVNTHESWNDRGDDETLRAFAGRSLGWLPVVRADEALVLAFGGVPRIPAVFVFRGDGELVRAYRNRDRPPPSLDELRADLAQIGSMSASVPGADQGQTR